MKSQFVFLQVGDDQHTQLMVNSLRLTNSGAHVIQCSDTLTRRLDGVDEIVRFDFDTSNLMTFRLQAFSQLKLTSPAIYLDTDMLVIGPADPLLLLGNHQIGICKRVFDNNAPINTSFKNMDLQEFDGLTLGHVFPIIACFTVTKDYNFWSECKEKLQLMHSKYHFWYGDQMAMKEVVNQKKWTCTAFLESYVACLPEFLTKVPPPLCLHFKGPTRKKLMPNYYATLLKVSKEA